MMDFPASFLCPDSGRVPVLLLPAQPSLLPEEQASHSHLPAACQDAASK